MLSEFPRGGKCLAFLSHADANDLNDKYFIYCTKIGKQNVVIDSLQLNSGKKNKIKKLLLNYFMNKT